MEQVERDAYDSGEKREPNAIKMQSVFYERPLHATRIIHNSLKPYFTHLKPASRAFYRRLIGEIMEQLSEFEEQSLNLHLEDSYLMGYYLQRNELCASSKEKQQEEEL